MNRFLNYELEEQLGRGGSAEVWRARTDAGESVAIKLFSDVHARVDELRDGEAQRLGRIDHPRILRYLASGQLPHAVSEFEAGTTFIVTELVRGPTLQRARPPDWPWVQSVTLQLLDAFAAAHARNIVHLDVKPSNVLLRTVDPVDAVLADFGIAHRFRYEPSPDVRPFIGTPRYMAPEQIHGYVADFGPWTDIYSLGCIVYELCTGRAPFVGGQEDILRSHIRDPPPSLDKPRFAIPGRLSEWLARCLVKDTGERFARAADAAWALVQVCRGFDAPAGVPVAIEPDELVVPDSSTITWVGSDLEALGGPPPPSQASELATFPTAALPASWSRGQDLDKASFTDFPADVEVADALWAQIHGAFRNNEARGVLLTGADAARRDDLVISLITRVFEFGVGTHVLLSAEDSTNAADRTMLQLFRADYFTKPAAAAQHCDKLFAAVGAGRSLNESDAAALRDWMIELVDGPVTASAVERTRLMVEFLRVVPRTPLVLVEGLSPDRVAFVHALLSRTPFAGTGAVVIVSVDEPPEELSHLVHLTLSCVQELS